MPGTSQKIYVDSFSLDLANHNSSTHTKANFRCQFLDFREACILSSSLLLGLWTAEKLGVVVVVVVVGGVEGHFSILVWAKS